MNLTKREEAQIKSKRLMNKKSGQKWTERTQKDREKRTHSVSQERKTNQPEHEKKTPIQSNPIQTKPNE